VTEHTQDAGGLLDPDGLLGRGAVVTGGAQGIGRAVATALVGAGAIVVLADLDEAAAAQAAEEISDLGLGRAVGVRCDVTDEAQVQAAAELAVTEAGSLQAWVNNAGITRDLTLRKMSLADFRAVVDVHLVGGWLGTRAAAGVMREQGTGSIVNISSISGKVGNIGQTNYSAAKAGLVGLTKAAAKELAYLGVRVNAVQPGLIRTAMVEAMRQDIVEARVADIPLGRVGEPADVAEVVLFLAGSRSSYMTGTVTEVTGGRWM